jgi:hypothetical protein
MRKLILGALLPAFAVVVLAPAVHAEADVAFHVETWSRYEMTQNRLDQIDTNSTTGNDDDFTFGISRTRVAMDVTAGDSISAYIEVQNIGNWGDALVTSNPADPQLAVFDLMGQTGFNEVDLYQAWFGLQNVGGTILDLKIGRMEDTLGNEAHIGDNDFYGGQFFDGINGTLDFESFDLGFFYYMIQERNVGPGVITNPGGQIGGSDDSTFMGITGNVTIAEGHELEPYALNRKDGTNLGKFDFWTIGALYQRPAEHAGPFDWSLEFAIQTGELDSSTADGDPEKDLSSDAIEGAIHYALGDESASHHRFGIGFLILGDGDGDFDGAGNLTESETFVPLFPDTHRRLGLADQFTAGLNSAATAGFVPTDYYIDWAWTNQTHTIGAAFHMFQCTDDNNGTANDNSACFAGVAGEDDLGNEVDIWYNLKHGEHFNVEAGIAQFMPGDVFSVPAPGISADDDVLRAWVMGRFRM